jgi:hypothetical protein
MYEVDVTVRGKAAILMHAFPAANLKPSGPKRNVGETDYSLEWMDTMYATNDGFLYIPASHFEGALMNAAASFKVKGKSGATWKKIVKAYCYVNPDEVPLYWNGGRLQAPDENLLTEPDEALSVDVQRVVVQRSAVARARLKVSAGWEAKFTIEVQDEQVQPNILKEIVTEAGRAVGVADYRPRYGRFDLMSFDVREQEQRPAA